MRGAAVLSPPPAVAAHLFPPTGCCLHILSTTLQPGCGGPAAMSHQALFVPASSRLRAARKVSAASTRSNPGPLASLSYGAKGLRVACKAEPWQLKRSRRV